MARAKTISRTVRVKVQKTAEPYQHPSADSPMRPDVGTQAQFKKKLPPKKYRYDDSLSPVLEWDSQNPARERGEKLICEALEATSLETAKSAVSNLKAMSQPFLNWSGKAERLSFDVPTLPLFIHERLSTKAILETLKGHKRDKQMNMFELYGDPQHSISDQILRAYEHRDEWVNRMILGDSLVVMNSLLHYEGLGGQVQMIYMDPPYGVKFGSNFQPFVRKRDVSHGDDEDMTREPEMVQAYRDTWELGLHSYLTYLKDRLLVARELLTPSGSIFVQIGDENVHLVRCILDEVFGSENFIGQIAFKKSGSQSSDLLASNFDYLLWFAKQKNLVKFRPLYVPKEQTGALIGQDVWGEFPDGTYRRLSGDEDIASDCRLFTHRQVSSPGETGEGPEIFEFEGKRLTPPSGRHWSLKVNDLHRLAKAGRLFMIGKSLRAKTFIDDFAFSPMSNVWADTSRSGFGDPLRYVVETSTKVLQRVILMTTDPGDLVLDPTCGSGTTAYCAEQWGRRWITIDTSRVPLALARQRLLTATYPWYELQDETRGPARGFVYNRKQNKKGEEVGGIVPHVTLESIANNEPPKEEVRVDRPELDTKIVRVTGSFAFEATIPTPQDFEEAKPEDPAGPAQETEKPFVDRMLEVLRRSPVIRLGGKKTLTLKNVRPLAKTISLSAEAMVLNGVENPVAIVFGPENGAVVEKIVYEAAKEANAKNYSHLYVIGFAIDPNARMFIEKCSEIVGISATYFAATLDLMMGDLLKNMRSSQIFSECGLPEIEVRKIKMKDQAESEQFEVELLGLDVFDPITMSTHHYKGDDVPAWLLDTDYNGLCFHVSQAFFPRTGAWENLKKALNREYEEGVWDHLAGTVSAHFDSGEHKQIAVKAIDYRGNELLIVKSLDEAR